MQPSGPSDIRMALPRMRESRRASKERHISGRRWKLDVAARRPADTVTRKDTWATGTASPGFPGPGAPPGRPLARTGLSARLKLISQWGVWVESAARSVRYLPTYQPTQPTYYSAYRRLESHP